MTAREFLRVEDVAAELGLGPGAIRGLIRRGTLPAVRIGRRYFIRREALVAMFRAQEFARAPSRTGDVERLLRMLPPAKRRTKTL